MTKSILLGACAVVLAVPGKALGAQQLSGMSALGGLMVSDIVHQ